MSDTEKIRAIVSEWLTKPFLKRYAEIGKEYLTKQEESKENWQPMKASNLQSSNLPA